MDQKKLQEKIALYYSKLPPKLQGVFSSMDWLETIKKISGKYSLNNQQIETLSTETTLVLLGIVHPEEYEGMLRNELGLSRSLFETILGEINASILDPFRAELTSTFQVNAGVLGGGEQKLDERFNKLPQEIQNAIIDSNYHAVLYQIAESQKLTVEEMGVLEKITTDVMLGTTRPENFEDSLRNNLKLPVEKIATLVEEINEKILKSIRMRTMSARSEHNEPERVFVEKINQNEANVLEKAGIKITEPVLDALELNAPPKQPAPILDQKLAGSFQTPAVKTEHKLDNISKPARISYPPKADPYRINPDE